MKKKFLTLCLIMFLCCLSTSLQGQQLTGDEILDRVDSTFTSLTRESEMKMTIVFSPDQKRERTIKMLSKSNQVESGLVIFLAPADVRGTTFLTRSEEGADEDMWLYLPAVGNVRRIASHMRGGSFMGTDFTYEDMSIMGTAGYRDRYSSQLIGEEEIRDRPCYLIESIPEEGEVDYSKLKLWVDQEDFIPLQIQFFDQKNELLKTMHNEEIESIDGHLTPLKITMENVKERTKTILQIKDIKFDHPIDDNYFTTRYMERAVN